MAEPFIIALDDTISRLACLATLVGAVCIRALGWEIGWVLVIFGVLFLWLARQFAIAPLCSDAAAASPREVSNLSPVDSVGQG